MSKAYKPSKALPTDAYTKRYPFITRVLTISVLAACAVYVVWSLFYSK